MQYEIWGRSKQTKVYEFLDSFTDPNQKWSKLDEVDTDIYYEAMIVKTDYNSMPRLETYVDLGRKPNTCRKKEEEHGKRL